MKIFISEYNTEWAVAFEEEKVRIHDALRGINSDIEHIGSTSVHGLMAKPIIDIMVGLPEEADLDKSIEPLKKIGYNYIEKFTADWPERRFFQKNVKGNPQVHAIHIHVFVKDSKDWIRHIAFRDYLRNTPHIRDEYAKLKKQLSETEFNDRQEYQDAKSEFIEQTEKKALKYYQQKGSQ